MKKFLFCWLLLTGIQTDVAFASKPEPHQLQLASISAAVAPLGSHELEFSKRDDWVMPIASLTKLMTALVVMDSKQPLEIWLPILKRETAAAANAYSRIRLGSEATRRTLLQIALMSSENQAAYLLARHNPEGYTAFIAAMNAKAAQLGMKSTRFVDPSGLSEENVSTARDLVRLVNAAYQHPEIREFSVTPGQWIKFRQPRYGLQYGNTNPLVHSGRWNVSLSKTGYLTIAGRCLAMVTDIAGEAYVMILLDSLGTRTPLGDAGRIRRWLETGNGGTIAGAALNYEREKAALIREKNEQTVSL